MAAAPRVIFRRKTPRAPGSCSEFSKSLAVHLLVGHVNVDALYGDAQQFGIVNLYRDSASNVRERLARTCDRHHLCAFANNIHERFASTCDRHHVAFAQHRVRSCVFNDPVTTYALDKNA